MITLSIIIPVRNKWELTFNCLKSLAATCTEDDYEVIVIDNASDDETAQACLVTGQNFFSNRFHVLYQYPQKPFAASCNAGAQLACGELLLFLNNDTIALPNWRNPLQTRLQKDISLGAIGPLLLYPDVYGFPDRVQHLGIEFNPELKLGHLYECFPATHPVVQKSRKFQAITAAAMLVRRKIFFDLGGFYEQYINGYEDVDFCLHLRQRGLELTVEPKSQFYHLCSQTPGRKAHDAENAQLLSKRCLSLVHPDAHLFLREDGYSLRFSPWLLYEPTLHDSKKFQLSRLLHQTDQSLLLSKLKECIEAEPFWKEGYLLLAHLLESKGKIGEALNLLFLGTEFWSDPDILYPLLHLAQKAVPDIVPTLTERLQSFVMDPKDRHKEIYRKRAYLRSIDRELAESANLDNFYGFFDRRLPSP